MSSGRRRRAATGVSHEVCLKAAHLGTHVRVPRQHPPCLPGWVRVICAPGCRSVRTQDVGLGGARSREGRSRTAVGGGGFPLAGRLVRTTRVRLGPAHRSRVPRDGCCPCCKEDGSVTRYRVASARWPSPPSRAPRPPWSPSGPVRDTGGPRRKRCARRRPGSLPGVTAAKPIRKTALFSWAPSCGGIGRPIRQLPAASLRPAARGLVRVVTRMLASPPIAGPTSAVSAATLLVSALRAMSPMTPASPSRA